MNANFRGSRTFASKTGYGESSTCSIPRAIFNDLRAPPANRLEALTGNRRGQHSIRINSQWRICFIWTEEGPADVEIVDYH